MGAQLGKQRAKSVERKSRSVRTRLQKLRKNRTAPLFSSTSTITLDKCDSLMDIQCYKMKSPSDLNLDQVAKIEVDERPEDWIRAYKDMKNKVLAYTGNALECRALKQELEAFIQGLDECEVWELRSTLLEKIHRLGAQLDDMTHAMELQELQEKQDAVAKGTDERDEPDFGLAQESESPSIVNSRQVQAVEAFLDVSTRLDAIRYRMVLYYGDDKQSEFHAILEELQEILLGVKAIRDHGALHVIVTREEYEDYITALQQRFLRLVEVDMRQAKTSICNDGAARTARIRRNNVVVSAAGV